MTRLAPQLDRCAHNADLALTMRWRVGLGQGLDQSTLELSLTHEHGRPAIDAALIERAGSRERVLLRVHVAPVIAQTTTDASHDLTHIDVRDERGASLLALSFAHDDSGAPRIRYARTTLFARFNVRGGRYEPLDARLPAPTTSRD